MSSVQILDKDYRIEVDSFNYTLVKEKATKRLTKEGKPLVEKDRWYCRDRKQALQRYLKEVDRGNSTAEEIIKGYDKVYQLIENLK